MKFWDYVEANVASRLGYKGDDWSTLVTQRGREKVSPEAAVKKAFDYASLGAAMGAFHPDVLHAMFERTYAPIPEEQWQELYAAGLDIPSQQPRSKNYREEEEAANKGFMEYCREFRPEVYSVLKD
jgi:hypothetical protein